MKNVFAVHSLMGEASKYASKTIECGHVSGALNKNETIM